MKLNFKEIKSELLSHNSIGQSINISRAQDLGWDFSHSNQSIIISEQNSNLNEIINLFPTEILTTYQLEITLKVIMLV